MLQRIQSIYLLLATAVAGLAFVFPFGSAASTTDGIFQDGLLTYSDDTILLATVAASAALALVAIFLYRNYALQKGVSRVALVANVGAESVAVYDLFGSGAAGAGIGISLFLPTVAIVCIALALRGIQHDERIIKSSNRIR